MWSGADPEERRTLPDFWTGTVLFTIVQEDPGPVWTMVGSRKVRKMTSTRLGNIMLEDWQCMGKAAKRKAIRDWQQLSVLVEKARGVRARIASGALRPLPIIDVEDGIDVLAVGGIQILEVLSHERACLRHIEGPVPSVGLS